MNSRMVNLPTFLDQVLDFTFYLFASVLLSLSFLESVHLFIVFPARSTALRYISTSIKSVGQTETTFSLCNEACILLLVVLQNAYLFI